MKILAAIHSPDATRPILVCIGLPARPLPGDVRSRACPVSRGVRVVRVLRTRGLTRPRPGIRLDALRAVLP